MAEVINFELLNRIAGEEGFLWQYDYGQRMKFSGVELPMSYTVHFANSSTGDSIPAIGDETGVGIPDQVLQSGKTVYFWLFLHPDANSGQTVYANMIRVHPRTAIPTIEPPTPEEQSILDQLMAALEAGIAHVEDEASNVAHIAEGIPQQINDALAEAKASGEFKGDPGAVFTPEVDGQGILSWENNGGLPNPTPADLKQILDLSEYERKEDLIADIGKGQARGVAELDDAGKVPSSQLPSFVDDVVEYPSVSQFPVPGERGKIYVSTSNNHSYRWTGTGYIDLSQVDVTGKADKRDTVLETTLSRGRKANTTVGTASVAFGGYNEASGDYTQAFGYGTAAIGNYSYAEGYITQATGVASHAEGTYATASGNSSHAEGTSATASGVYSHAEGNSTQATGESSHAEGTDSTASGNDAHAEGRNTTAFALAAHAEGSNTTASGMGSHAEGISTYASNSASHAEGLGGTFTRNDIEYTSGATKPYAHSEGDATLASGDGAHSEGFNTVASGNFSHAEGYQTDATAVGAHSEGNATKASGYAAHSEGSGTKATGDMAHAEGNGAQATGDQSHAEGTGTLAGGDQSHAEGSGTQATGDQSHSEGGGTKAIGPLSHAEGGGTRATASSAHSEGGGTLAGGQWSHAEGGGSQATANSSHAEGSATHATAVAAHAEGGSTQANGISSHAENIANRADGEGSHAEGYNTQAIGVYSHSQGNSTIANGKSSHVFGEYNLEDSYSNWEEWVAGEHCVPGDKRKRTTVVNEETVVNGYICNTENTDASWTASHWDDQSGKMNYAEIVGNGTGTLARNNARTLDWEGNERLNGDLYIRCNGDGTGGTKIEPVVYATDSEIDDIIDDYGEEVGA